jgi:putative restriction endonuclease
MPVMERRSWTRDQLLKTLALYCQIPFGKMHSRNPAVAALASVIERTPSAVALKLVNFASLDPDLQRRGVGGMGNVSHADRAVWEEFYGQWKNLADHSVVEVTPEMAQLSRCKRRVEQLPPSGPTEVTRDATVRRGQSFFRAAVLAAYDGRCCITGITSVGLLRASHIVPWSQNPSLRLDPHNGLCLNALHDAAFDRGLITLSDQFELLISRRLKSQVPDTVYKEMFEGRSGTPIKMPERFKPAMEMLEFHRNKVFCG